MNTELYQLVLDGTDLPICAGGDDDRLIYMNKSCRKLFADNGNLSSDITVSELFSALRCGKRSIDGHVYSITRSGMKTESGEKLTVCCIYDITDLRDTQEKILVEYRYRRSQINDALIAYEINISKDLILSSPVEKNFGTSITEGNDCFTDFIRKWSEKGVFADDKQKFIKGMSLTALNNSYKSGDTEYELEYRRNVNGIYHWVRAVVHIIEEPFTGDLCGFIFVKDINREKTEEIETRQKAECDSLTGLFNRGKAMEIIEQRLSKHKQQSYVLFMIDFDNFKFVNDTYGHSCGDEVLCNVGYALKREFRGDDIAARIGGDEFIVFASGNMTNEVIERKAKTICKCFSELTNPYGEHCFSGSVGVCATNGHVEFAELYKSADEALYKAKNSGKNRWCINKI